MKKIEWENPLYKWIFRIFGTAGAVGEVVLIILAFVKGEWHLPLIPIIAMVAVWGLTGKMSVKDYAAMIWWRQK